MDQNGSKATNMAEGIENSALHQCRCNERNTVHVHCPCELCEGKAVPTTTAWRHRSARRFPSRPPDSGSSAITDLSAEFENPFIRYTETFSQICASGNSTADELDLDMVDSDSGSNSDLNEVDQSDDDMSDGSNPSGTQNACPDNLEKFLEDAILQLVEMKAQHGFSIKAFEQILNWGREIHGYEDRAMADRWPKRWEEVIKILERLGYKEAQCYWICLDSSHPCSYSLMNSKDEHCRFCGKKGNIPYYYLSILDKVRRWCMSPAMCQKMTAHWQEKDHWLNSEDTSEWGWAHKNEIWDGNRFSELSYFWNPDDEFVLPVYCPSCHIVISASDVVNSPTVFGVQDVTCPGCYNHFKTEINTTNGDPRNLAYIAHWDGWQPFSSSVRGCGAIEVTIATMSKSNRCSTEEVYVIGFVPSYLLPNKRPISLDPFIEPLIRDIESGFINGINVNYSIDICGMQAGNAVIRHLILCWSGDHNGQCEVGKIIKCGKCPCRRCKLKGVYIPGTNHYYYPGFRKSVRYPHEHKTVTKALDTLKDIEEEERISVKQAKAREAGYTGLSILHRLNALYGFEYDRDLVYDELHAFSLNIVKNHVQFLKEDENNSIDWEEVDKRLDKFPWTREFKASRVPRGIISRLGYWKGEEYYKFVFPASEIVFRGLLSEEQSEIWLCIARMAEFLQNHARNGWVEEDAYTFHSMVLRYAILTEEYFGPTSCHITLHNLLHLREDIKRFSGLDNYSCWVQERAVQRYVNQSSNCKNIEVTFAGAELRREVVKVQNECSMCLPLQDKIDENKLWARSLEQAQLLYKAADPDTRQTVVIGVTVGGMHNFYLNDNYCRKIAEVCDTTHANDVSKGAFSCKSVWKPLHHYEGLLYRENEFVIVIKWNGQGEIIGKIQKIYTVAIKGAYKTFITVQVYDQLKIEEDGTCIVKMSHNFEIVPLANLSRKVMLYPSENIGLDPNNFVVIDFMRRIFPISAELVVVPYYPVLNDMVDVLGDGEVWKARVTDFSIENQRIQGIFYIYRQNHEWVPESSHMQDIHFKSILGLSNGVWVRKYSCWQDVPL